MDTNDKPRCAFQFVPQQKREKTSLEVLPVSRIPKICALKLAALCLVKVRGILLGKLPHNIIQLIENVGWGPEKCHARCSNYTLWMFV